MKQTTIIFKYGKRKFVGLDIVDMLAEHFSETKGEVKRMIVQGGVTVITAPIIKLDHWEANEETN